MNKHVKAAGWLWIVSGVVTILMAIGGLIIASLNIPGSRESLLVASGSLCLFIPGIIAAFAAGYGLLNYRAWARILSIILGIINLIGFPFGTALGIYTLVIMFNEETAALFRGEVAHAGMEKVS